MNNLTQENFPLPQKLIFWGGTGQAKVMRPVIQYYGSEIVAVIDRTIGLKNPFDDVPLIHDSKFREWLESYPHENLGFCITIGNPHGNIRVSLHKELIAIGLKPITIIHPTAWIAPNAKIGLGAQIQAYTVIEAQSSLGIQCIINTKASVDHECILEDGVEIAPGATLCGQITVEENAWVCAGATVLPRLRIGKNAIVGAGAVVTKNVPNNVTVIGVPAKIKLKKVYL